MHSTRSRQQSGHAKDEPALILLWRQPVHEAVQLANRLADSSVVLVRLVNQTVAETVQAACKSHGLRVVALPVAFAGLRDGDRVLRDAVLQRLQRPCVGSGTNATPVADLSS